MATTSPLARSSIVFMAILVVTTALGPFAMQIFLPALPIIQDDFAVSAATTQLVFSLSAFAIAIATLFYGPLSDQVGRRPAMLFGLVVFIIGSWLCAVADSITWLIAGRIVQAAGGCAGMVLSRAIIRDVYDREKSAQAIAYVTMAMVAAPMVAPVLGGLMTDIASWRFVFWTGIGVGIAVLAAAWWMLPETHAPSQATSSTGGVKAAFLTLLRSRGFLAYALQAAFSMSVFFAFLGGAPYVMLKVFGLSASQYGLCFMIVSGAFMIGNYSAARLTKRIGIANMILLGSTGTLLGAVAALLAVAFGEFGAWGVFLPMGVTALFQGLAVPNAQAAVVSVHPEIAGSASGLGGFVQMGIAATTAQIVGSFQTGSAMPMVVGMALMALLSYVFAHVARRAAPL